ncbi:segregation/condensation protein A [Pradoshia sp.]
MSYKIKIDAFEGPLDLLLHLINRLEIDIYDIPVAEITEQYVAYIHTMKELELDVASEYLVMAATLLAIKSKMLLPKHEDEWDAEEEEFIYEEDPRDELVMQLLEYKKYKEAAGEFKNLEAERALIYTKPPIDLTPYSSDANVEKADLDVNLYDMLGAFQKLLRRKKLQRPLQTRITRQEVSIEKRIGELRETLRASRNKVLFSSLFVDDNKEQLVVTFMAILEMMKQNEVIVEQTNNFEDIFIAWKQGDLTVGNH